jgi:hypothetical protein
VSDSVHDQPPARKGSSVAAVLVLLLGVLTVLASAGAGVYFVSEWAGDRQGPDGRGTTAAGAEPASGRGATSGQGSETKPLAQLISARGFEQFVDALKEETGSTSVVDLTLYPRYAVVVVPLPGGKGRTQSLYYDGAFRETTLGTTTDKVLDLRKVDARLLVPLSRKARNAVEEPDQWYLILGARDIQGAVIYAYASNKFGEGGYVAATLDGKVVNRVGW